MPSFEPKLPLTVDNPSTLDTTYEVAAAARPEGLRFALKST